MKVCRRGNRAADDIAGADSGIPAAAHRKEAEMATLHRARAILNIDRRNTGSVLSRAKAMDAGIGSEPALFASPNPALSVIQAQIVVVDRAEVLAGTRAMGTASARNVQRGILVGMLETECTYVQGVADTSATPDQAVATIQAAGLMVARVSQYAKAILTVRQGAEPGSVTLDANASALGGGGRRKTFFNWESTADGKTFITVPPTPKSKTTVANLTPLSTYGFRVSLTDSDGMAGPWSQVVAFFVH
jgi:hypothetical protein